MLQTTETPQEHIEMEAALSLFSDDYAKGILEVLSERPSTAAQLRECCKGSKVTIYRRLNSLEDAGLISSRVRLRSNGNHCKIYFPIIDSVTISITENGFDAEIDQR